MASEYAKIFSLKFRQLRVDSHKTQDEIAETLDVTQQTVQIWEKGEHTPKIATLVKVARHFHVTVDWLLGIENVALERYSDNEKHFIGLYRQLNAAEKDMLSSLIDLTISKHKEKNASSVS